MRVAIVQSSYIPWKGYFDLIGLADHFVIYDEVQYTRRDWRNRNRIKTERGPAWLTIPVLHAGRTSQRVDEAAVVDAHWRRKHWRSLLQNYEGARFFDDYAELLRARYLDVDDHLLSRINEGFIRDLCNALQIETPISRSTDYPGSGDRVGRLIELCVGVGADVYLTGPRARGYLDEHRFAAAGIAIEYMSYTGYREYGQRHPPFEHEVSVLDLLFEAGGNSPAFLKSGALRSVVAAG